MLFTLRIMYVKDLQGVLVKVFNGILHILYNKSFYIALIIYILPNISVSALEIRKHNKPEIEIDYPRLLLHRSVWDTPIKRKCLSRMNYCVYGYGNTPGESNRIRLRSTWFTYPYTATQTLRKIIACKRSVIT